MLRKITLLTVSFLTGFSIAQAQVAEPPRFSFDIGGGFSKPVDRLEGRLDTGWNLQAGAGINILPRLGIMGQFMYTESGLAQPYLQSINQPDGNFRMWGLTVDPVIRFNPHGHVDFYLIGGGGVYRRTVEFTRPTTATVVAFDPLFGLFFPVGIPANEVLGSFSTTRPGLNGGGGFSVRLGNGNAKLFAEARYHRMFTEGMSTSVLPVTFGLRW